LPKKRKPFENELVEYLVREYFSGSTKAIADHTRYAKHQIDSWFQGAHRPQNGTLRYLLSSVIAPELKIVCEFSPVSFRESGGGIREQLRQALSDHQDRPGIYAFYDSMCNVFYVGKAAKGLLNEMYQQLRNPLGMDFPKAIKHPPRKRWEVACFASAYEVPSIEHLDYPRHVESLVLRMSKPSGNKILGKLNFAAPPKDS